MNYATKDGERKVFDDGRPIYQQIAERVKDSILNGDLREGEQVMSTNEFSAFYRINPATSAKGLHLLVDEGLLFKKRGIGMFVSPGAREQLLAQRRERFFSELVGEMVTEARLLGISLDSLIEHLNGLKGREQS